MQEKQDNVNHCLDSMKDRALSGTFLKPLKKTCSMCFIGSETTQLRLVVLNPIESYLSFFEAGGGKIGSYSFIFP